MESIDGRRQGADTRAWWTRALLGATALIATALPAAAQNATWLAAPPSNDFNTAANWTPATVPTGTAFFGTSNTTSLVFSAVVTTVGSWTFNAGASAYTFTTVGGHFLIFDGAGIIVNGGSAAVTNNQELDFNNASTAGNAAITNTSVASSLSFLVTSTAGNAIITNGRNLNFFDSSTGGNATIITNSGGTTFFNSSSTGGNARFITNAGGTFEISKLTSGGMTAGSIEGAGAYLLGSKQLTAGSNDLSTTVSGVMQDGGAFGGTGASLVKVGTGTLTLAGVNTYTGATIVDAGTLAVNGSIATSSLTTVNNGGTLAGTGTVGNTTIAGGGIFAPGSGTAGASMTVAGSLAFQSGAIYLVQISPSTASFANVTGTASLTGGSVQAVLAGSYTIRSYDILHATGGLGGTTFGGVSLSNPNFGASLSYSATDVFLNLTGASLGAGTPLNQNQANAANAINGFFNGGGTLLPGFGSLFGLTGGNLANALTQLSGEAATGAQQGAFQLMDQFLDVMLDPFVYGTGGFTNAPGSPARAFAPERDALPEDIALAYAKVAPSLPSPASGGGLGRGRYKAPVPFEQRWTAWGSAYGGYNKTGGDGAMVGSHDLTARAGGVAAGLDYHVNRDTVVGVALAGGATSWDLAQSLGGGRSDAFQAGVYGATHAGPAYLAAALAFANHWMSTDRFAAFGDHLTARFDAQSIGGRVETGYRFATGAFGVTPYGALTAQNFRTPFYSETDLSGGGFALSYAGRTATDTRGELGARFDQVALVNPTSVLTLRGRLAWAYDWITDPSLAAVFQALPGASFIVNGATPAKDSALASVGAELRLANGVALIGKFDGEFAGHSNTYAGTGTVRVSW